MITEDEYIALQATTAAYCALLYSLNKESFLKSILTSKEATALIEQHVGYDFDERSIINALDVEKPYKFADRVSGRKSSGAFKIDDVVAKQHYLNLASAQASLVWQLENLDHKRFHETIDEHITEAKQRYAIDREYDPPLVGQWMDVNLWMQQGMFHRSTGTGARLNRGHSPKSTIDWTKWGTVLTGVGILVAILLWKLS